MNAIQPIQRSHEEAVELANNHIGLLFLVARKVTKNNKHFSPDDVLTAGYFGLTRAAECFDVSLGFAFSTYAASKIRGAVLDEMRRCSHIGLGRRAHTLDVKHAKVREKLSQLLKRSPTSKEVSSEMSISLKSLIRSERLVLEQTVTEFDGLRHDQQPGCTPFFDCDEENEVEERYTMLRNAMKKLNPQERYILTQHFFEGRSYCDIASDYQVSGARTNQIALTAITKLRVLLSDMKAAA
jgi:RNA polymerase sigma factor for flagellar operon FliA